MPQVKSLSLRLPSCNYDYKLLFFLSIGDNVYDNDRCLPTTRFILNVIHNHIIAYSFQNLHWVGTNQLSYRKVKITLQFLGLAFVNKHEIRTQLKQTNKQINLRLEL